MKKTKVAKAIAMFATASAICGGAISTAFASDTMYNTYNAFASSTPTDGNPVDGTQPTTDGWVYGKFGTPSAGVGGGNTALGFVGIGGSSAVQQVTPFGYNGGGIVNWGIQLTSTSDSGTISQADSFSRYGVYADIDVAKGAWSDNAVSGAGGWRHNADIGLFQSSVDTVVHLSAQGLTQSSTNFGFTIFQGMDTSTGAYGHHGSWNAGNNTSGPTSSSLIAGGTNFTVGQIVAYSVGGASPSNLNDIYFNATAGQVYTIVLGGYRNGAWGDTADGYVLNVSAVPIPGAVWLFGSAMAGLGVIGRRKAKA